MATLPAGPRLSGLAHQIPTTPTGTWTGAAATAPATRDSPLGLRTSLAFTDNTLPFVIGPGLLAAGSDRANLIAYKGFDYAAGVAPIGSPATPFAGVTVTLTSGLTATEAAGTVTFTVVLTSQPTADVTIALSSSDTTEGTVGPASLTFASANWNVAQEIASSAARFRRQRMGGQ